MIRGINLRKVYKSGFFSKEKNVAVDGVDIAIGEGETVALVGESGCGKSTLGKMLLMQTTITGGAVFFKGNELTKMKPRDLRSLRQKFQLISQHPEDCLNPRWEIGRAIAEPLLIQGRLSQSEIDERVRTLAGEAGLQSEHLCRYPHELSGGELQRAIIARAIALRPEFIVCDEPTSMLDVSVQAAVISLLKKLQTEYNLSYLFITHDLELAEAVGDRIAVMYAGQIIEEGTGIFETPMHPYTKLMSESRNDNCEFSEIMKKNDLNESQTGCRFYPYCSENTCACLHPQELVDLGKRRVRCNRCTTDS